MAKFRFLVAFDTSDSYLTLALKTPKGVFSYQEPETQSAQVALTVLNDLCQKADCALSDIECFVVTTGPGRFAGIRSSIALTQGLAWGLNRPVIGVPTLSAWAFSAMRQLATDRVWVCMDARMHQWAHQCFEGDPFTVHTEPALADKKALEAQIGEGYSVVGTGLETLAFKEAHLCPKIQLHPEDLLGCAEHLPEMSSLKLAPCYLRPAVV